MVNMKTALLFPGQASQYVGMGKDLYETFAEVRALYEFASAEIGEDLAALSFHGPAERLKETRFTQPAILVHSLAVLSLVKTHLTAVSFAAGHSLGEYGALVAAESLSPQDAIRAVVRRAMLMEEACRNNPGTMAATMGLEKEKIEALCIEASQVGTVVAANYNSDAQIVVSGSLTGVEKYIELAKAAGAKRAMKLEVGGAFHSPLMASAREGMKSCLTSIQVKTPRIPVVANVTARPVTDGESIRELLVRQISEPVRWSETMAYLKAQGVSQIFELGPGKVLTGLAKRELAPQQSFNIDTLEDIKSIAPALV